ncbi:MAG: hypothetical protein HQM09_00960 [Candidatus Riflebacteria bacterium]|nr:hypothetical protein [Candidatus Riflebacteria bacterium]
MKTTEFSIDKAAKLLRIERTDFDEVTDEIGHLRGWFPQSGEKCELRNS